MTPVSLQRGKRVKLRKIMKINAKDNVAIALEDIQVGQFSCAEFNLPITAAIKRGHKIALCDIKAGDAIIKYGYPIGIAKNDIMIGEHVHTHNCRTNLDENIIFSTPEPEYKKPSYEPQHNFMGYQRADGNFGIRNEIWIIPTVGCVANICKKIGRSAIKNHPELDGKIHVFGHQFGCSQLADDLGNIKELLGSLICHPNAYRVLLVGLGCENNQGSKIIESLPNFAQEKTIFFKAQEVTDEFETALNHIKIWNDEMVQMQRTPAPLSSLKIAVKCGGSDGMSGLSANPLVGHISDKIYDLGGTIIMGEIPEIFGAEQVLLQRCSSKEIQDRFLQIIKDFKEYFTKNNIAVYENPSPGNKDGGITTLEEKSLGAVQKAGKAIITDLIDYGRRTKKNGLNVVYTPGNDGISSTAFAAAGAHIILFTTGRGTPMGFPVPTLKIASNNDLAERKPNWIDFNAGKIVESGDFETLANELMELIIQTVNGNASKNEINDEREIAIWKNGVTL